MRAKRVGKVVLALLCAGVIAGVGVTGAVIWCAGMPREQVASDCIIVLGARVWPDGRLSDSLTYRCESALEAYQAGLAPEIVVTGAQGADEPASEAEAMRAWFVERGVDPAHIHVEDRSRDTSENLKNAREIMRKNGWESAVIVTSDYHLQRALWIARDLEIQACGIAAQSPRPFFTWTKNRLREAVSWGLYALRKIF